MRSYSLLLLVTLFLSLPTHGQTQQEPYAFNCNTLQAASDGCKSYNEMVTSKDTELISQITSAQQVYVCFRPAEDVFMLFDFNEPGVLQYHKTAEGYFEAYGHIFYKRYKDGLLEESRTATGTWLKAGVEDSGDFITPDKNQVHSSIGDSEVSVTYEFPNLHHTITNYSVSLRRSTLRFSEEYTFPQTPIVTKKGVKQDPPPPGDDRLSYTGYCAHIKPNKFLFYPSPQ